MSHNVEATRLKNLIDAMFQITEDEEESKQQIEAL